MAATRGLVTQLDRLRTRPSPGISTPSVPAIDPSPHHAFLPPHFLSASSPSPGGCCARNAVIPQARPKQRATNPQKPAKDPKRARPAPVTLPLDNAPSSSESQSIPSSSSNTRSSSSSSSSGSPRKPINNEVLMQSLGKAKDVSEVLQLDARHGSTAAPGFYHVALLAALARCTGRRGTRVGKSDLQRVEARLPSLLKDLAPRLHLISFRHLSTAIPSLCVLHAVFPRLEPLPAAGLATGLITATRNATTPPSFPDLERAFTAVLQLYGDDGLPDTVRRQLQEYLRTVLVEDPGCMARLVRQSDSSGSSGSGGSSTSSTSWDGGCSMADLASAVALVVRYDLPQPADWVEAVAARVDGMLSVAHCSELPQGVLNQAARELADRSRREAERRPAAEAGVKGGKRGESKDNWKGRKDSFATDRNGISNSSSNKGSSSGSSDSSSSAAGGGGGGSGRSRGHAAKAPTVECDTAGGDLLSCLSPRQELDATSLARLLVLWSKRPPPSEAQQGQWQGKLGKAQKQGKQGMYWLKWLAQTTEAVWMSQEEEVQAQRAQLMSEFTSLVDQLKQQQQQPRSGEAGGGRAREDADRGGNSARGGDGGSGGARHEEDKDSAAAAGATERRDGILDGDNAEGDAATDLATAGIVARLQRVSKDLNGLGPAPARTRGTAAAGTAAAAAAAAAGVVPPGLLVELAEAVGTRVGEHCSRRSCKLAEAVLRRCLEQAGAEGQHMAALKALAALARMGHSPTREFVSAALLLLLPKLEDMELHEAHTLLSALRALGHPAPRNPKPAEVLEPLASTIGLNADRAPLELITLLLRTCAAWGVPVPGAKLTMMAGACEVFVRQVAHQLHPDLLPSLYESKRFQFDTARGSGGASSAVATYLNKLLHDALLPLAQLGQAFPQSEVFFVALHDWRTEGFPDCDVRKAALLMRMLGLPAARGWYHRGMMREDINQLLLRALSPDSLTRHDVGPEELSGLLLDTAEGLRVVAKKMRVEDKPIRGGIAETSVPQAAPLLLPAAERLLSPLQPSPEHLAAAMQALFVRLEWANTDVIAGSGSGSGGGGVWGSLTAGCGGGSANKGAIAGGPEARALLLRMLERMETLLEQQQGCSAKGCAYVLVACARCGVTPSAGLLTKLYSAALITVRGAPAEVLISLAYGIGELSSSSSSTTSSSSSSSDTSSDVSGGGDNANTSGRSSAAAATAGLESAREELLQAVAATLLQPAAMSVLEKEPALLVNAVWRIASLGVPLSGAWLQSYGNLVQGLMPDPKLSARDLAYAGAGLALLGGQPKSSFVDTLLTEAEKRVTSLDIAAAAQAGAKGTAGTGSSAGGSNWIRFAPYELGLLLGAAHGLQAGRRAAAGSGGGAALAPLSSTAQRARQRAHITFVRHSLCMYRPAELQMVVAAVTACELARAYTGAGKASGGKVLASGGTGSGGTGSGGMGGKVLKETDFMGRLEADWLHAAAVALLRSRQGRLKRGASSAASLPTPGLLIDLLRLASRVVACSTDGSIRRLVRDSWSGAGGQDLAGAGQLESLLKYVCVSVCDWAMVGGGEGEGEKQAGGGASKRRRRRKGAEDDDSGAESGAASDDSSSSSSSGEGLSIDDWRVLLRALLDAGLEWTHISPALEAFCTGLFTSLSTKAAAGGKRSTSPAQWQDAWSELESALTDILLPVLPWAPSAALAAAFRQSFLLRAPLESASMWQLGLLSTYCTHAGLGSGEVWSRVRAELLWRLPQRLLPPQEQLGGGQAAGAAEGLVGIRGRSGRSAIRQQLSTIEATEAGDVAAVWYALELGGCGVGGAVAAWILELEEQSPGGQEQEQQQQRKGPTWAKGRVLPALPALHLLWAGYCARQESGCAAAAADAQWQAWQAAFSRTSALELLLPQQLLQLVKVYAEAKEDGCRSNTKTGAMTQHVKAALLQRLALPSSVAIMAPDVASAAIRHCLPAVPGSSSSEAGVEGTQAGILVLAEVVEPALPVMPLAEVAAVLRGLDGRSEWRLTQQRLEGLVERLLGAEVDEGGGWSLSESMKLATVLTRLAPEADPSRTLSAVTPLLVRLFPGAEADLCSLALQQRLGRLVCNVGAAAATGPLLEFGAEECGSFGFALESADAASGAMAAAIPALLTQQQRQQQLQSQQGSLAASQSPASAIAVDAATAAASAESPASFPSPERRPLVAPYSGADAGASFPTAQAADLITTLVAEARQQPLPLPLAATALWLLGQPEVFGAVSLTCLRGLVLYGLRGHDDRLLIPDDTARQLLKMLQVASGWTPLGVAGLLRRRGASAVLPHELMAKWTHKSAYMESLPAAVTCLQEMYESGVKDRVACSWFKHGSPGLFSDVAHAASANVMHQDMLAPDNVPLVAEGLRYIHLLESRLSDWDGWALRASLIYVFAESDRTAQRRELRAKEQKWGDPQLWVLLEWLSTLGPALMTREALRFSLAPTSFRPATPSELEQGEAPRIRGPSEEWVNFKNSLGTIAAVQSVYHLRRSDAAKLLSALMPLVHAHSAAGPSVSDQRLSSRQLGLLYGMSLLRSMCMFDKYGSRYSPVLHGYQKQLWPLYLESLDALVARSDMAPGEHLTAVLDALEPVICADIGGRAVPDHYITDVLPPLLERLADVLAPFLQVSEPPLPVGVTLEDEMSVMRQPRVLSEELLLDDLFWPPGTPGRVQLPRDLLPPDGRRHGFGDPEGDAAREAYLRQVVPGYLLVRRVQAIACIMGVDLSDEGPQQELAALLAARGVTRPGSGRWSRLLWSAAVEHRWAVNVERLLGNVSAGISSLIEGTEEGEQQEESGIGFMKLMEVLRDKWLTGGMGAPSSEEEDEEGGEGQEEEREAEVGIEDGAKLWPDRQVSVNVKPGGRIEVDVKFLGRRIGESKARNEGKGFG